MGCAIESYRFRLEDPLKVWTLNNLLFHLQVQIMPLYQIRTVLKQDKIDEFSKSLRLLWFEFLKEEGCLSYRVYQEFEKENIVFMLGEFSSHEAMADHFQA